MYKANVKCLVITGKISLMSPIVLSLMCQPEPHWMSIQRVFCSLFNIKQLLLQLHVHVAVV